MSLFFKKSADFRTYDEKDELAQDESKDMLLYNC